MDKNPRQFTNPYHAPETGIKDVDTLRYGWANLTTPYKYWPRRKTRLTIKPYTTYGGNN